MSPFDFSRWSGDDQRRKFTDLALSSEQVESILSTKHGISEVLLQEFPDLTRRGTIPHAFMKALLVFEEYAQEVRIARTKGITDPNCNHLLFSIIIKFMLSQPKKLRMVNITDCIIIK